MRSFIDRGLSNIILCPGSRSAPLALAAVGLSEESGINVYKAIDERSAAFMALGLGAASGKASIVITTSGTAVSNLLSAAVEADRSCQPIIFLTADRPRRLKECGANQSVNQEDFLASVCRKVFIAEVNGVHLLSSTSINSMVNTIWDYAHSPAGPVHLNFPIEEPLHPSFIEQKEVWNGWNPVAFKDKCFLLDSVKENIVSDPTKGFNTLDPFKEGLIVAGPWRGAPENLLSFKNALRDFQSLTGWPVFADPLSGVSFNQPGMICFWELLISCQKSIKSQNLQILRLGPLPSSRRLELFLQNHPKNQILITEFEKRYLDPLHLAKQYSHGLSSWVKIFNDQKFTKENKFIEVSSKLLRDCQVKDKKIKIILNKKLKTKGAISEPSISRYLLDFIPLDFPVMLSASSPVRDFLSYSGSLAFSRRCFSFRGASGIDGNLSLAVGLSTEIGPLLLMCGDLAFLHDTNALLLSQPTNNPLIILLIDNQGGGIFKQLNLDKFYKGNINEIFTMPQQIDHLKIAKTYGIPFKDIFCIEDLKLAFEWAMKFCGPVIIRARTDSQADNLLRKNIIDAINKEFK